MTPETTPLRFNWRNHPRPASRQEEQAEPPMFGPFLYDAYGTQRGEVELPMDDGFAEGLLFQGMRHDPDHAEFFTGQGRHFSPALKAWAQGDSCGLNVYNAPVDEPISPVDPLGT